MDTGSLSSDTPSQLTPRQAWDRLMDGNFRFIESKSQHPAQDADRRAALVDGQNPFAVIFGCSDSRLAAEIIFDVGLGDVFVVRTAGQVASDGVIASLEYSVDVLGVPLIIVLGHDHCGAVTVTQESFESGQMPDGYIRYLVERILPSVLASQNKGHTDLNSSIKEHIISTTQSLENYSQKLATAVKEGKVAIVGTTYSLADGKVHPVTEIPET